MYFIENIITNYILWFFNEIELKYYKKELNDDINKKIYNFCDNYRNFYNEKILNTSLNDLYEYIYMNFLIH